MSREKLFKFIGISIMFFSVATMGFLLIYFIFIFITKSLLEVAFEILMLAPVEMCLTWLMSRIGEKIWNIGEKERMKV